MTHAESRARRMRVLGYCRAYPRDTDAQVAAALGLEEATVLSDRKQLGCTCRRVEVSLSPAARLLLGMLDKPMRTSRIIARAGYERSHVHHVLNRLKSAGLVRSVGRPAVWTRTAAGRAFL